MIRNSRVTFLTFLVIVVCMAICPVTSAAMAHVNQAKNHCHEENPSGKDQENGPRCCGQQAIVKSDPETAVLFQNAEIPHMLATSSFNIPDFSHSKVEYRPQKTGDRLATLSVLRI